MSTIASVKRSKIETFRIVERVKIRQAQGRTGSIQPVKRDLFLENLKNFSGDTSDKIAESVEAGIRQARQYSEIKKLQQLEEFLADLKEYERLLQTPKP